MKHLTIFLFNLLFLIMPISLAAQWYVEISQMDSHFSDYSLNVAGNPDTTVESFSGVRDNSFGLGYLIPFKSLEERLVPDAEPSLIRLGVGLGFDQLNLKTNSVINNVSHSVNYDMAQVQGRLGLYLTHKLFSSNESGTKNPKIPLALHGIALDLHGGLAYNRYTAAIRQHQNTTVDLTAGSVFKDNYGAYFYGAGLQFFVGPNTQLYARYTMENAFNIEEKINSAASQNYGFDKTKLTLGLLIDLERANKMRKKQQQRMKDFDALVAKMQANESQDMLANESVSDSVYAQVPLRHIKGHLTYEAFDFVEFQFNSYELDESKNKNKLSNLAKFLADHPNTLVKLVGYADISGVIEHNLILSQKRADSVKEYLHNNYEIDNNRMLAVGAGETLQFSSDDYTYNRVTQILILE
jgi:outer membrane protein OmpA-like peptidoglycan-associated protein